MPSAQVQDYVSRLTGLARQWNTFTADLEAQRHKSRSQPKAVREPTAEYMTDWPSDAPVPLFTEDELEWLQAVPNT